MTTGPKTIGIMCGFLLMLISMEAIAQSTSKMNWPFETPKMVTEEQTAKEKNRPEVIEKLELQYFGRCISTNISEANEKFCACTALRLPEFFSEAEMTVIAYGQGGEYDQTVFERDIVGPCFGYPMGAFEENKCLGASLYRSQYKTQESFEKMCSCMKEKVQDFFTESGDDFMGYLIARKASPQNYYALILKNQDYRQLRENWQAHCIRETI